MRALLLAVAAVAAACTSASASTEELRARVSPAPSSLTTRAWTPAIALTENGRRASARLALTIRKGAARRTFRPRATRRGSYRVRVVFPSDGRWLWTLLAQQRTLARGAISVSTRVGFELPFDVAVAPGGTILFLDRSRVLALDPTTRRVRVHATTSSRELVGMERLADGTLFVTDLPGGRVLRIDSALRVTAVARVPAPVAVVADARGTTLWVASIADGVGVVRVDTASGRTEPFARVERPHGLDRDSAGNFYVHDGHAVSRVDGATGAVSPFADIDAFDLRIAPDGTIYGIEGTPAGGRVVRIGQDGSVTAVVGTNRLGPHRDGAALEAEILPSAVDFTRDGALLVAQTEPLPAIRRVDLATGLMTTLVRGR